MDAAKNRTTEAISLFPNLLLTVFNDNLRAILIEPRGPGACHERVEIFFVGDESLVPELEPHRQVVAERFPSFNREVVNIVERLQESFETAEFDRAHFSEFFDENVYRFQQKVKKFCMGN